MINIKSIVNQLEELSGIKDIVGASEEIASMKMRGIRTNVLQSRDLNDELTEIYQEVTVSYKNHILALLNNRHFGQKKDSVNLSLKHSNGKTAAVYLSANSGLFAKVLEKTYDEFIVYLSQHAEAEPVIIGEYGKKLFETAFPGRKYVFYPFAEDRSSEEMLKNITTELGLYANVIIFYARFESMAQQTVTTLDVIGQGQQLAGEKEGEEPIHYLFEPSLEKILTFFESEIFVGIIQQTVTESELARYASRITVLDMARENINLKLKAVNMERRVVTHRMMNKKQTESLSGISLWNL